MTLDSNSNTKNGKNKSTDAEENKMMCRLLKIQIDDFFENIYIPVQLFREDDWKIKKVIKNNQDALFYNDKYASKKIFPEFSRVFVRYRKYILDIMTHNTLMKLLMNWTDTETNKWTNKYLSKDSKSFINMILNKNKFKHFSPVFIIQTYQELNKTYDKDKDKVEKHLIKRLKQIDANIDKTIEDFENKFLHLVEEFVFTQPLDIPKNPLVKNLLKFINQVLSEIIKFTEKLLNLNTYNIHSIVCVVIDYYLPLDFYNEFYSDDDHMGDIYIL